MAGLLLSLLLKIAQRFNAGSLIKKMKSLQGRQNRHLLRDALYLAPLPSSLKGL